jgi:hypothetical protein
MQPQNKLQSVTKLGRFFKVENGIIISKNDKVYLPL